MSSVSTKPAQESDISEYHTTITPSNVRVLKEGKNEQTGRAWVLYAVDAINDKGVKATLTTFDAGWREKIGQPTQVTYSKSTREVGGKTYTDLRIVDPRRGTGGGKILAEMRELLKEQIDVLKEQNVLLHALIEKLSVRSR